MPILFRIPSNLLKLRLNFRIIIGFIPRPFPIVFNIKFMLISLFKAINLANMFFVHEKNIFLKEANT